MYFRDTCICLMNDWSLSDCPYFPGFSTSSSDLGSLREPKLLLSFQEAFLVHVPGGSCRFILDLQKEQSGNQRPLLDLILTAASTGLNTGRDTLDTLKTHLKARHADHIRRWSRTHVASFFLALSTQIHPGPHWRTAYSDDFSVLLQFHDDPKIL